MLVTKSSEFQKTGGKLDQFNYHYEDKNSGYKYNSNKLRWVDEEAAVSVSGSDLEDQDRGNYDYDDIGNLQKDNKEEIANIEWTVYEKVAKVTRLQTSKKPDLEFTYDANGNRVMKIVKEKTGTAKTTYYLRDATGNTMAVYEAEGVGSAPLPTEWHMYGSSRLGIHRSGTTTNGHVSGLRSYEVSDHLGNVSLVMSDLKSADIIGVIGYYPFGMAMDGRSLKTGIGFRYGAQGQEKLSEFSEGVYTYEYRIQDSKIGRFFSIDPLQKDFSWNSSYCYSQNRVIDGKEIEGLEVLLVNEKDDATIYNVGVKNTDKSAIHIYAHGTPGNMDYGGGIGWSNDVKNFKSVLERSDVYNNRVEGQKTVVIIHSCRLGRSYFNEGGQYVKSYAEQLSAEYKDLIIIAPDERDYFGSEELGPYKILYPSNKRADYALDENGNQKKAKSENPGNWNVFEGGAWTGQLDSDFDPGGASKTFDYKFNYYKVNVIQTGTVKATNLNVRSSAGFGNNGIGLLAKGTSVTFTGKTSGNWAEISMDNGGKGWVSRDYVDKNVIVDIGGTKKK